jgi:2-methylcitrate dehydratase PrpD
MDDVSYRIGRYVSSTRFEDLSPGAIASAKRSTLDTMGAMIAGSSAPGIDIVEKLARRWGGNGEAHLVGFGHKLPAPIVAWCNGTMARALEIDDCFDFLPVHPSASIIPALLVSSESNGCLSGREFLTAVAVGQDLTTRIGMATRQTSLESGRLNMFEIFGPTAALARAMKFAPEEVLNALGIAFSHAVGDGQAILDGALTVRLRQGIMTQGAFLATLLTSLGFTGAKNFLLGRWGYLNAFEPDPRLEYLTQDLGKKFYGEDITIKPFSSCRATHASIDLALQLRDKISRETTLIRRVLVRTCPEIYHLVGEPRDLKIAPDSVPTAQFSIQFTVAAALLRGDVFLKELQQDSIKDKEILDLAHRVYVESDDSLRITNSVLGRTVMEIDLEGQGALKQEIEMPLGNPSRPFQYDACVNKFMKCSSYSVRPLEKTKLEKVTAMVSELESVQDVSLLVNCLF